MQMVPKPTVGFWHKPLKGTTILKAGSIVFLALAATLSIVLSLIMKPPKETKIIEDFQAHRVAYERLRDMFLADQQIMGVHVGYGVKTADSPGVRTPSDVNFSVSRYAEYVALLKEIGKRRAFRTAEKQSNLICVIAWGAGWAGDTRHVWICWTAQEPANQIASLDAYYRDPRRSRDVFRHIDSDWYIAADW